MLIAILLLNVLMVAGMVYAVLLVRASRRPETPPVIEAPLFTRAEAEVAARNLMHLKGGRRRLQERIERSKARRDWRAARSDQ